MFFADLSGGSFGGVYGRLKKYLDAGYTEAVGNLQPAKDGGRLAVKKIQVGEVDSDRPLALFKKLGGDTFDNDGVVEQQFALDAKHCAPAIIGSGLGYLSRHFYGRLMQQLRRTAYFVSQMPRILHKFTFCA